MTSNGYITTNDGSLIFFLFFVNVGKKEGGAFS